MAVKGKDPDDAADALRRGLRLGLGGAIDPPLHARLGLPEDTEDLRIARALVHAVTKHEHDRVDVTADRDGDPRPARSLHRVEPADASFLGQLGTEGEGTTVAELDDVRTVLAVLRAGGLRQRRAAVRRLSELLSDDRTRIPSDLRKRATDVLSHIRDVEINYELSEARAKLSGAIGREVRAERDEFQKLCQEVDRQITAYWDGELAEEPVTRLPGDQRALLLLRVRDLSDTVVDHLGAFVESADGDMSREDRIGLMSSLRFAGDPRLVAPMKAALESVDEDIAMEAARALGRIEDARVQRALAGAYERNVVDRQRTVLAGALGLTGDRRGLSYLRKALESDDADTVRHGLEALSSVGGPEDAELVSKVLEHDHTNKLAAVRCLGRIGDGRALKVLESLREQTSVSALWAELEDATMAIRARMELRGEAEDTGEIVVRSLDSDDVAVAASTGVRLRSWTDYWWGHVWLFLGGAGRAIARFERAAARRPGWVRPVMMVALIHARRNRYAQALATFRRAIEINRHRVERNPTAMGELARSFLRRAEEVERDGRHEVARGLLEEVLALDLRRAPTPLRFEVARRHEAMRRRAA